MLRVAFVCLSVAVLFGGLLLAGKVRRYAWLHGVAAALGLGLAVAGLRGPMDKFALDALVLLTAALAGGLVMVGLSRAGRPRPGLLVMLHAMAGGLGYLLLSGFVWGR